MRSTSCQVSCACSHSKDSRTICILWRKYLVGDNTDLHVLMCVHVKCYSYIVFFTLEVSSWTGVGRFGANILRWGVSTSDSCDCGAEQTADHISSGNCPIYSPPEGKNGLIDLNNKTRTWLENIALCRCEWCVMAHERRTLLSGRVSVV